MNSLPDRQLLRRLSSTRKFIEGDCGWLFLTNDTNDQLAQQFGFERWSEEQVGQVARLMGIRKATLPAYSKFIVPEKSVAYREYMPGPLRSWPDNPRRPVMQIDGHYLLPTIEANKAFGPPLLPR